MVRTIRLGTVSSVLLALLVTTGCFERRTAPITPRLGNVQSVRIALGGYRNVDLVLVVDDSGSMSEEQDILEQRIGDLVRDLTSPADADGDGQPDWSAVERLRIAIVTTDMGTSDAPPPINVGVCAGRGDDGQYQSSGAGAGAEAGLQVYDVARSDEPGAYSARIGCIVDSLGTSGCGIEQQLEAAARAVERGGEIPGGFPADDAILAVLVLTDEEDCSLAAPNEFYSEFARTERINVLCQDAALGLHGASPAWLTSLDTLAARMSAGRDERSFVFAAITGLPIALSGRTAAEILADPDMEYGEMYDPSRRSLVPTPACTSENGDAAPARRIVELGSRFPRSVLHSICADDFGPAIRELAAAIAQNLGSVCLTRRIPLIGDRVECDVRVTLPPGEGCDEARGQREVERDEEGRAVCQITQVPEAVGGEGYFYEDSEECPQLTFTPLAQPPLGSTLEAECYFETPSGDAGAPPVIEEDAGTPTGP